MDYVAGFLFSPDGQEVALVLKNRPRWQAGLLNAVGGKVEGGEMAYQAMRREFLEEAGMDIPSWRHDSVLTGEDFRVDFFSARADLSGLVSLTDEAVAAVLVSDVLLRRCQVMRNLPLLLSVALDDSGIQRPVMFTDAISQE